ncbi:hypothetical protein ACOBQX_01125 [Actinokineospora sp. G85]
MIGFARATASEAGLRHEQRQTPGVVAVAVESVVEGREAGMGEAHVRHP